jgi:hypothetical protein
MYYNYVDIVINNNNRCTDDIVAAGTRWATEYFFCSYIHFLLYLLIDKTSLVPLLNG